MTVTAPVAVGHVWHTRRILRGPELRILRYHSKPVRKSCFYVGCTKCLTESWMTVDAVKIGSRCRCERAEMNRARGWKQIARKKGERERKVLPPPPGANPTEFIRTLELSDVDRVQRPCERRSECLSYAVKCGWASWDCRGCEVGR